MRRAEFSCIHFFGTAVNPVWFFEVIFKGMRTRVQGQIYKSHHSNPLLCPTIDNTLVGRFLGKILLKSWFTSSGEIGRTHLIPGACSTLTRKGTRNPGILWTEWIYVLLRPTTCIYLIGPVPDSDTNTSGDRLTCFNHSLIVPLLLR